jgi:serine/threonine protein kinase
MSFKGGAIEFKDDVVSKSKDIIQAILTDEDTSIKLLTQNPVTPAYLFTITFNNDKFSKYFKKLPGSNIPSVLLLKLMAYEFSSYSSRTHTINKDEFTFETIQHLNLSTYDNTFPICPSFIYSERISYPGGKYTLTGGCIFDLLNKFGLYSNITQTMVTKLKELLLHTHKIDYRGTIPIENVSQHIIIMEYYSCITLKNFIEDTYSRKISILSNYYIYGIELPPMSLEEFGCILTLFVSSLMLVRGFIHGDLHKNNILLCVDDKQNINPVVIDFGRTSRINFENKFDTSIIPLINIIGAKEVKDKKVKILNSLITTIYYNTEQIRIDEMRRQRLTATSRAKQSSESREIYIINAIERHIKNLLFLGSYVEAGIVSSMCCLPSFNTSVFYFYIEALIKNEISSYRSMYYCKSKKPEEQKLVWNSYDVLLKRLLEAREVKTQSLVEAIATPIMPEAIATPIMPEVIAPPIIPEVLAPPIIPEVLAPPIIPEVLTPPLLHSSSKYYSPLETSQESMVTTPPAWEAVYVATLALNRAALGARQLITNALQRATRKENIVNVLAGRQNKLHKRRTKRTKRTQRKRTKITKRQK